MNLSGLMDVSVLNLTIGSKQTSLIPKKKKKNRVRFPLSDQTGFVWNTL